MSDELHMFADAFRRATTSNELANILVELKTWSTRDDVAQVIEIN